MLSLDLALVCGMLVHALRFVLVVAVWVQYSVYLARIVVSLRLRDASQPHSAATISDVAGHVCMYVRVTWKMIECTLKCVEGKYANLCLGLHGGSQAFMHT